MERTRALALVAAFVAACAAFGWWSLRHESGLGPLNNPTDFVAFYCAGRVAAYGADPYRAEPLRTCERAAFAESRVPMVAHLVVPAPLPGYALALFAPFSLVSFRVAAIVWAAGIVAAVGVTVWSLCALLGVRPAVVAAALAGCDLYASLVPGQLVPYVVCALAGCGVALARDRPRAAAVCACAMFVEPHLGLPVALALALWVPRTRVTLVAGAIVLAALSLAFLDPARNLEYATAVLPAQAATEGLEFTRQYGLSAALVALGVGARTALALGSASYLATTLFGVLIARRCATALAAPEAIAFVPAAAVLFGGAYVHIAQMAAAIPLALLLCVRAPAPRLRRYAVAATIALAIPWQSIAVFPDVARFFPPGAYVDPRPLLARASDGGRLAQDAWAAWIATTADRDHRTPLEVLAFKLPTWGALACLIALLIRVARGDARARAATARPLDTPGVSCP
jgi:hypothetical protein